MAVFLFSYFQEDVDGIYNIINDSEGFRMKIKEVNEISFMQ